MPLPRKLKQLILNIAPMPFWQSIRIEIHLFFVRLHRTRLSRSFARINDSLVNFGPGSSGLQEWVENNGKKLPPKHLSFEKKKLNTKLKKEEALTLEVL
jgi:hypothetical protein